MKNPFESTVNSKRLSWAAKHKKICQIWEKEKAKALSLYGRWSIKKYNLLFKMFEKALKAIEK